MMINKSSPTAIIRCAVIILLLSFSLPALAQPTTKGGKTESTQTQAKGKIYGLVTGISRYQDMTTYRSLRYADADAREFYKYLVSPTGGHANRDNVDTLMNGKAGFMEFWRKFNGIKERLQKGDVFYLYFSGHGDAYRGDEAYLLAYDAPAGNDRNNYSAGVGLINVRTLKNRIEEITSKGVKVILITDACRTNELPGKAEGQAIAYQLIFEHPAGEIQFISCSSNQVSFEGSQWGGGRGLFSWHLINGLKGMADTDPEDGEVTLAELYDYVKKNVNRASYDKEAKAYLQTPRYCCTTQDGLVLSEVTKEEKDKLTALLQQGSLDGMTKGGAMMAVNKGGGLEEDIKKAGLEEWHNKYKLALNNDQLVGAGGAFELLKPILTNKKLAKTSISELKFELSSLLMGDVAKVINTYFTAGQNNNLYTFKYFNTAAEKLKAFKIIADTAYYNPLDVEVNRLFLEGHSYWRSDRKIDQHLSMRKIDSAVALKPQAAYLYNLKGLAHSNLGQYELAEKAYRKAISLAPNWVYPVFNLGTSFDMRSVTDSSLKYYHQALRLDSNFQIIYAGLSSTYEFDKKDIDSAKYFIKQGLKVDPNDPYLYTHMGHIHLRQQQYQEALNWYHRGMQADSTVIYPYEGAMQAHVRLGEHTDSVSYYVTRMTTLDPSNPIIYESIGSMALEYDLDTTAYRMFELAVEFDSLRISAWKGFSKAATLMKYDTTALGAMIIAYRLDTTDAYVANEVGNLFYHMGLYESSLEYFVKAVTLIPSEKVFVHNVGEALYQTKDYALARTYFELNTRPNIGYAWSWYRLACLEAMDKHRDKMLAALAKAFELEELDTTLVEKEPVFADYLKDETFIALLKKEAGK